MIPDTIIEFIREKTGGLLKENSKEYQIYCPFCDDAYRKPNPRWGHLYISKDKPVFYCHRCNTKGHLIKLLQYLEFPEIEKYKHILGYSFDSVNIKTIDIHSVDNDLNIETRNQLLNAAVTLNINTNTLQLIEQYLFERTGLTKYDMERYFLKPIVDKMNRAGILFFARDFVNRRTTYPFQIRYINDRKLRYKKLSASSNIYYYLSNISPSDPFLFQVKYIIITEGPFDVVNLFNFYSSRYKDLLVISVSGSYYQKILTKVLYYFPFVETISLFIDQDIDCYRLYRNIMRDIRFTFSGIQQMRGRNFKLLFYKSATSKDYGDIKQIVMPVKIREEVIAL
jgi:hypothetical protein